MKLNLPKIIYSLTFLSTIGNKNFHTAKIIYADTSNYVLTNNIQSVFFYIPILSFTKSKKETYFLTYPI